MRGKQQFRQHCTKENGKKSKNAVDAGDIQLSSSQIEELKVKLLLETQSSLWPVETSEELGKTIARITKAVAERPFKYQFDFICFTFQSCFVSFTIQFNLFESTGMKDLNSSLISMRLMSVEVFESAKTDKD